jgi:hypothetical protein
MSQSEIDAAVAAKTGESIRTIRSRGFSMAASLNLFDPDDDASAQPQYVDWDRVQMERLTPAA